MTSESPIAAALRASIRTLMESPDHEIELASLLTMLRMEPELALIADQEVAPKNARLELHLDSASAARNQATAKSFGRFIVDLADSVKATVKALSGSNRLGDELLVETGAGALGAVLIAPQRTPSSMALGERAGEIVAETDLYSEALRRVGVVLGNANPELPDSQGLDSALAAIPAESRPGLRRALEQASKQNWSLEGTFRQRGLGTTRVHLDRPGVDYLAKRLSERFETTERQTFRGYLDGHTWSAGTMKFIDDVSGKSITAAFGSSEAQLLVGELNSKPSTRVEAEFTVSIISGSGVSTPRRTYLLNSVSAMTQEPRRPALFDDSDWL